MKKAEIIVPSWVIPGTYTENLRFLAKKQQIDGVELLFFTYDDASKVLFEREFDEITRFRSRFFFTAHLPDRLSSEHEGLVALLAPLVRHFIVHPAPAALAEAQAALLRGWMKKWPANDGGAGPFLIENTAPGNIEALLPLLDDDTKLCMDTGHLLLNGESPARYAAVNGSRIGEVHLHGLKKGPGGAEKAADHGVICATDDWFCALKPFLNDFTGVINVELFSWEDAAKSLRKIELY